MTIGGPDLDGLKDAQVRLRSFTGQTVTFYTPTGERWPPGTELDPESGKPYDPQIEPTGSGFTTTEVKCNVAFRPVQGTSEDSAESPVGDIKTNEVVLIMSTEEWATVEDAIAFDVKGDSYKLKKSTADGIGSEYRQLVWGERQGPPWA